MYVKRLIENELEKVKNEYPIITITGPRQSGKTTLVQNVFTDYKYFSLEDPDIRTIILEDPRGFLLNHATGLILDEVQRLPQLLSYIQTLTDQGKLDKIVLTGSSSLNLMENISQSLAGRTALLTLYPFSFGEIWELLKDKDTEQIIFTGLYPATVLNIRRPQRFFADYIATYVERDIRQIVNIKHYREFSIFLSLLAGMIGKNYNASALADSTGVSVHTINSWLSALEALFVVFTLNTYRKNIRRRLKKSPKIYFIDTGLVSYLLRIKSPDQLWSFPLRGEIFENLVIAEVVKELKHRAIPADVYYYQDSSIEVDLVIETADSLFAIEVKSAATFNKRFLDNIEKFKKIAPHDNLKPYILYNGDSLWSVKGINVLNYKDFLGKIAEIFHV